VDERPFQAFAHGAPEHFGGAVRRLHRHGREAAESIGMFGNDARRLLIGFLGNRLGLRRFQPVDSRDGHAEN